MPLCSLPMFVGSPCSPIEWIKKWFLRKRKADSNNRTSAPTEPTFVENEPSSHDGQALGHTHSKFWDMDAFATADPTSFSPSVGYIPKFYGHQKLGPPPGNADNYATGSQEYDEESAILSLEALTETDYGYALPLNSFLARENVEIATLPSYDLREVLLGADAFAGHVSPSADRNATTMSSEHSNVIPTVGDLGSALLLPLASFPARATHADNSDEERHGSATEVEFTLTNDPIASTSSPLDAVDDFFAASGKFDFTSTTSRSASDDLEFGAFDSTARCLDSDPVSLPGFANLPDYMTSILSEHSAFYESLPPQTKQDPIGDSVDVDFCLGAGTDHFAPHIDRV